jgi:hypothetical protein
VYGERSIDPSGAETRSYMLEYVGLHSYNPWEFIRRTAKPGRR